MALGRVPTIISIVFIAILLALMIALPRIDWNGQRAWVAEKVSKKTGRSFVINGDLSVKLSTTPRIRAEGVVIGNAPWGSEPTLAAIDVVEFEISLTKLLFGQLFLPDIQLTNPRLLLEKNAQGEANWELGPTGKKGKPPILGRVGIQAGKLRYRDSSAKTDILADIATVAPKPPIDEPTITVDAKGTFKGAKFVLRGSGGALLALRNADQPYPLDLFAEVGGSRAHVRGQITDVVRFARMNLKLDMQGPDLAKLHDLIDVPLPSTPPYTLVSTLLREGAVWRLPDLRGTIGDSDIAGSLSIDNGKKRSFMRADLRSKRLDFDDIAGFIGAPLQTGKGETAAPEQERKAEQAEQRPRALPNKPFSVDKLRQLDADVTYHAERIKAPSLPVESTAVRVILNNGQMTLDPFKLGLADGELESVIKLDARQDVIATTLDVTARRVALAKLFPKSKIMKSSNGRFGGRARLTTSGNSVAQMAATADGALGVVMANGEISNLLLELAGLDAGEALRFFLGKDKKVAIRCAIGDFTVTQGVMKANTLVLDTTDTQLTAEGNINLKDEALDLKLTAHPKDRSLFSARTPLFVRGTFKEPKIEVDKTKLAGKIVGAIALGLAAPIAALLPLVETGDGKDSNCGALIQGVRDHTREQTGAAAPLPGKAPPKQQPK